MSEVDEIVQEFLVESHENLDQLDQDLVALEQEPGSRALLGSIFRTIHTIKGTSGFLAYTQLEQVTHVGENVLSRLRDGVLTLTPEMTSALLHLVDAVRGILQQIETTGAEGSTDHSELVATLTALLEPPPVAPTLPELPDAGAPDDELPDPEPSDSEPAEAALPELPGHDLSVVIPSPLGVPADAPAPPIGQLLVERGAAGPDAVTLAMMQQGEGDARPIGEILVDHGATTAAEVVDALQNQAETKRSAADGSIRVDVDLLDTLMRLVGELVLTRDQIVSHVAGLEDPAMTRAAQRLDLLAGELQEAVVKTRMQPIDNVWSKLTRVVRDLGVTCGKQVRLVMEGRDTELDRTVLEAVKDPLTHCVRNAVDHGIETAQERLAAGKPAEGTLLLRAFHEGDQVTIEVVDDGGGIDPAKVGAKAVEGGLLTADQVGRMSERELLHLVFLPGFSTASQVTNVSGRGVGMDVVRTNIESIGGSVDVTSVPGRGTTFRITIPLTLAIVPALA